VQLLVINHLGFLGVAINIINSNVVDLQPKEKNYIFYFCKFYSIVDWVFDICTASKFSIYLWL
jgi:hypothetical protein